MASLISGGYGQHRILQQAEPFFRLPFLHTSSLQAHLKFWHSMLLSCPSLHSVRDRDLMESIFCPLQLHCFPPHWVCVILSCSCSHRIVTLIKFICSFTKIPGVMCAHISPFYVCPHCPMVISFIMLQTVYVILRFSHCIPVSLCECPPFQFLFPFLQCLSVHSGILFFSLSPFISFLYLPSPFFLMHFSPVLVHAYFPNSFI